MSIAAQISTVHLLVPTIEPDPIEIDPRPCGECGLTINRHERIDTPEGPEFRCLNLHPDEMTLIELERRVELIRQIEVAEIFARLEEMDNPSKRLPAPREPKPYRTPQSTVDAFWYVVRQDDTAKLEDWLAAHPRDAGYLVKRLEEKTQQKAKAR
jgi:hypothetical protein